MNKEVKGYLIIAGIVLLTMVVVARFVPASIKSLLFDSTATTATTTTGTGT